MPREVELGNQKPANTPRTTTLSTPTQSIQENTKSKTISTLLSIQKSGQLIDVVCRKTFHESHENVALSQVVRRLR